ncbi:BlaI/MecI/CopY family transcriptional regulator [Patescibacteria group bacterium]|nr:BlaI/MecI/CopY family transcriptional regulator [Patescibacteria group bacterium]
MTTIVQGKLETEVMKILWERKECSPKEVLEVLDNRLALTTVSTILERLYTKGLLKKNKVGGRVRYVSRISQEAYSQKLVKQFMGKMVNSFGDLAVTFFAKGVDRLPKEKKEELTKLLKEYEEK